jgi:hypothetical protein
VTVYVDRLQQYGSKRWCHVIADDLDELHAAAQRAGLRRAWFQDPAAPPKPGSFSGGVSFPHYDAQPRIRGLLVSAGAVELERQAFVAKMRELRVKFGILGPGNPAPEKGPDAKP